MVLPLPLNMTSLRTYATAALRRLAVLAGGVLLSRRAHRQLLLQRARAVQALTDIEIRVLTEGLTGVVFSKDRALQLYTLLSTYTRFVTNPAPLVVLYAASTAAHANAYSELQAAFSGPGLNVQFVSQGPVFKESLQAILDDTITKNIFFLVDDIIFIRPVDFSLASRLDTSNSILSLRHSPHLRRSYTASVPQSPPNFDVPKDCPGLLQFRWFEQKNEWSNPWSVDGQILSTAEIRVLTRISEFWAPNSYEGALTTFNDLVTGVQSGTIQAPTADEWFASLTPLWPTI